MVTPDRGASARSVAAEWLLTGLMLVALGCALAGLGAVLDGLEWWFATMALAVVVMGAAALTRALVRGRLWPPLVACVAGVFTITAIFVPTTALLWIIPTFESFDAFHDLEQAGLRSIATQDIPADAVTGIQYLLCVGIAIIAFLMDFAAQVLRKPAIAGIPLVGLLLVPSFVRPELGDPFLFALTAGAYLGMLLVGARRGGRRLAVGIGVVTIAAALVLPLALPQVRPATPTAGSGGAQIATGLNPILTLGDDLRRGNPTLAVTYSSTSPTPLYLRLAVLDDFTGESWFPSETDFDPANRVDAIGPVPGLADGITSTSVVSSITVGNILSRWLPAPYAPSTIEGLVGQWSWEPDGLSVRTDDSNARGQEYVVTSVQVSPSVDQLVAADPTVGDEFDRYLDVPADLPDVVAQTAAEVTSAAATNYDRAVALQAYFTGGDFTYSEQAPVDQNYDGSGASVLAAFLDARSGYCVHFSSAMAAMARTLGIPARVAVGFTPGEPVAVESPTSGAGEDAPTEAPTTLTQYRVTTHNFHAWPELYFAGIGWVRFEPTPGRGEAPRFAPLAQDDPATPEVDESVPPAPDPTAAPTTAPTATPDEDDAATDPTTPDSQGEVGAARSIPWWWSLVAIAVLLLAAPFVVRQLRRQRRLTQVQDGSATAAWEELRATADDLGIPTSDSRTPRQLAADLLPRVDDRGAPALRRLLEAVEAEAFAERSGEAAVADVRTVRRALQRRASFGQRLLGIVFPRSLFTRWFAQIVGA